MNASFLNLFEASMPKFGKIFRFESYEYLDVEEFDDEPCTTFYDIILLKTIIDDNNIPIEKGTKYNFCMFSVKDVSLYFNDEELTDQTNISHSEHIVTLKIRRG
jgi:hypothetical protein